MKAIRNRLARAAKSSQVYTYAGHRDVLLTMA